MRTRITCLIALCAFASVSRAQTIQVNKDNRTIAITATDSAETLADTADVTIGFIAYGTVHDATYADASRLSNRIVKSLADSGVKPDQIQSQEQELNPVDPGDKTRYSAGLRFVFHQSWKVTVKAAAAAQVLHIAVTNGANDGGNIQWRLADEDTLEAQAAEKALAHAQKIAERMASGLHAKLGPLVYASNQVAERPMMRSLAMSPMMMKTPRQEVQPLAVSADKVSRSATVYAVFSVE